VASFAEILEAVVAFATLALAYAVQAFTSPSAVIYTGVVPLPTAVLAAIFTICRQARHVSA